MTSNCPIQTVARLYTPTTPRTATVGPDIAPPADIAEQANRDDAATHALRMTSANGAATVVLFRTLRALCASFRELYTIDSLTLACFVLRR